MQFVFENHLLDIGRRELLRDGVLIPLQPKAFDLLHCLIANRERVVTKDDLISLVWGGRIVSDSTLASRINAVRVAVQDSGGAQKIIRTIPRRGLRFVGEVAVQSVSVQPAAAPARPGSVPDPVAGWGADRPAVAVLAFENMSGDPEQEYFCDGISEDILSALSKVRWFFVVARNSSFSYKGKAVRITQIANELGVRYVVEGSVRKSVSGFRITAALIDGSTGAHVWTSQYDRDLADVFAVQDEITNAVVAAIEPQIYAAENFRASRKPPNSLDAWDLVIRALSHFWRVTRGDHAIAQEMLKKAVTIDPNYGRAHAVLANSLMFCVRAGWMELAATAAVAERAALLAVAADSEDAWAHTALGRVYFCTRRLDDSISELELALRLNPNFCLARGYYALALCYAGRPKEALAAAQHAIRLSPRDPSLAIYYSTAAYARFMERDYDEAIALARKAISQRNLIGGFRVLTAAAGMAGDFKAARAALHELRQQQPNISLDWVANEFPWKLESEREHYLKGFRRAGLR